MGLLDLNNVVVTFVEHHANEATLTSGGDVHDHLGVPPLVAAAAAAAARAAVAAAAVGAGGVRGPGLLRPGLLHRVADALHLGPLVAVALEAGRQRAGAVRGQSGALPHQRHGGHHREVGVLAHVVAEGRVGVAEVVLARLVQAVPVPVLHHPGRELAARVADVGSRELHDFGAVGGRRDAEAGRVRRDGHPRRRVAGVLVVDEAAVPVLVGLVRAQVGPVQFAHHVVVGAVPPRCQALELLDQVLGALHVGAGRVADQQPRVVHAGVHPGHGGHAVARALVVGEGVRRVAEGTADGPRLGLLPEHGVQRVVRVDVPADVLHVRLPVGRLAGPRFLVLQHVNVPLVDNHADVAVAPVSVGVLLHDDVLVSLVGHAVALADHAGAVDGDRVGAELEPLALPLLRERAPF